MASNIELWWCICCKPYYAFEQTGECPVNVDAVPLICRQWNCDYLCNLPVTICPCSIAVHQNTLMHTWPQRRKFDLTHRGRMTHICGNKLTIIGSDNGSSTGRCQAIIWTNAGILLIGPLETNFSEILMEIYTFSFKKMDLKMSAKWRPFHLGLNVITNRKSEITAHNDEHTMWPIKLIY